MSGDEFRDYILGFIFFKFLSERLYAIAQNALEADGIQYEDLDENDPDHKEIIEAVRQEAVDALGYEELENSFTPQIETYTKIFFGTVVGIFIISFVLTVDTVIVWPFELTFSKFGSLPEVLKYFAFRLPILFPLVWLAIFASRRRGQYERLQQEYAHKKALARSYYSYKNQIDDLGEGHSELSGDLIKVMVDAISFNASQTLSGQAEAKVSRSTLDLVRDLVDPKNRPQ